MDYRFYNRITPKDLIAREEIEGLLTAEGYNKNEVDRTLTFRINKDNVDRYGSVLVLNGWKLSNYRQNPVFLYQHNNACFQDSVQMPVGRSLKEWTVLPEYRTDKKYVRVNKIDPNVDDGTGLYQLVYFPDDKNSEAVLRGFKTKLLNTVSAGFNPYNKIEAKELAKSDPEAYELLDKPKSFISLETELLESSAVSVPGNTQAKAIRTALSEGFPKEFLEVLNIPEITERFGDIRAAIEIINRSTESLTILDKRLNSIEEDNKKFKDQMINEMRNLTNIINTKLMSQKDQLTISDEFLSKIKQIKDKLQ